MTAPPLHGGFWELPPRARDKACADACKELGIDSIYDLGPAERAAIYEKAASDYYKEHSHV